MKSEWSEYVGTSSPRRVSSVSMDLQSHFTILKPQESLPSVTLSMFRNFNIVRDKESWKHRARMIFRILSFSLGPGNIWRFPQVAFNYGNAIYIYLYIIYIWIFGVSLLVFEISLSQYFIHGFAKMFTLCPIMEGITLSMAFYCVVANLLYSSIGAYSILYSFSGLYDKTMGHSFCSDSLKKYGCEDNYTKQTSSPEYIYFFNYVERAMDDYGDKYNWRNFIIFCGVWMILCIIILLGVVKYACVSITLGIAVCFVLVYLSIVSLTSTGSYYGMHKMFVPDGNDGYNLKTWIYPIEQCVVTLGLGAGPLTTIWSVTKIKFWSHRDCIAVTFTAFVCSMLAGIIFFNAAAAVAVEKNSTIENVFGKSFRDIHVHIVYTQLINFMNPGVRNFTVLFYYFILFCSCCFSLLEYVQLILLYIGSYVTVKKSLRGKVIVGICVFLFLITANISVSAVGYEVINAINKNFISTALLIIIFFELVSVSYFYGLRNFCDDIEFMLGFVPNIYYQVTWILLPGLFGFFSVSSLYLKFKIMTNDYDLAVLVLMILLIIGPVLCCAAYKCFVGIRDMGIRRVLNPRLDDSDWYYTNPTSGIDENTLSINKRFVPPNTYSIYSAGRPDDSRSFSLYRSNNRSNNVTRNISSSESS